MHDKDDYILLLLLEVIGKILRYAQDYQSPEELFKNDRNFDATMMNFIVIGENTGKLSNQFKENNPG